MEKVIMPTSVRVDIKAATWEYPAPLESRVFPKENATKVGKRVIEPMIAEKIIPNAESMTDKEFQIALYKATGMTDIATGYPQESQVSS